MQLLAVLFLVTCTSAAALPQPAHAISEPVQRAEATTGPTVVEGLGEDSSIVITIPLVTAAPVANPLRVATDPDYESSSSACTPTSICWDGMTCSGIRYGGCYDKNFCAGSTSFPVPTCTDDPSTGLTQNFKKHMEEEAAGKK